MLFEENWINNLPQYLKHDIEMVEKQALFTIVI